MVNQTGSLIGCIGLFHDSFGKHFSQGHLMLVRDMSGTSQGLLDFNMSGHPACSVAIIPEKPLKCPWNFVASPGEKRENAPETPGNWAFKYCGHPDFGPFRCQFWSKLCLLRNL